MSFGNFLRKLSFEADRSTHVPGTTESTEHTGMSSIFAAPGKLFDSVNAKTGHLVSDLNQKLDLSGKLDTLKQVSVNKFEHVVHGSSTMKETRPDECTTGVPPRAPLSNPFNTDDPASNSPGASMETEKSNPSLRRQSTHTSANRPPRPPPPTAAALSRAMSLDETNLSKHIPKEQKASKRTILSPKLEPSSELDEERSMQHAQDMEDGRGFISPDPKRHSDKLSDDDGDSSASEYGAHGDQPVYMPEPVTDVRPSTVEQEQMRDAGLTSAELSDDSGLAQLNAFMDLCVSALLRGRWNEVQQRDSELQSLLQTSSGRMAFVNQMEEESVRTDGLVASNGLPVLLEKISYLLNECQDAEDFAPARKLLTSSLLYYVEG
ncbi:hypothetical protein EG68_00380 [Paragonimus skrjabini miyazakii]|uniref:Uncharacterized protein n=1 Tax=Paragonimus skrjabini miyazakii TaxID=59628 RepID=A0A8S9Z5Y0_9TREM|nr:hypothetical protein EG68_00380 [Paragonimus skrjabini miyazakii]